MKRGRNDDEFSVADEIASRTSVGIVAFELRFLFDAFGDENLFGGFDGDGETESSGWKRRHGSEEDVISSRGSGDGELVLAFVDFVPSVESVAEIEVEA